MIHKGNLHNNAGYLGKYLMKDGLGQNMRDEFNLATYLTDDKKRPNEVAVVFDIRGFARDNIVDALRDIQLEAEMTRCEMPVFHVQTRLRANERLTEKQWTEVADRTEKKFGLENQPRVIVFHDNVDTGERHAHFVWSRIDRENQCAIPLGLYKRKLMEVQRTLERDFGLEPTRKLDRDRDFTSAPRRGEYEESRRLGTDVKEIRETVFDCYRRSDTGKAFMAALAEHGMSLARGERRDYVVVDKAGGIHAMGKRIVGQTAQEIRHRFRDIDREQLLTVNETRAIRRAPIHRHATMARTRSRAGLRGPGSAATKTSSSLAKGVESVIGAIASIVVSEPVLTRQQAVDQRRAETDPQRHRDRAVAHAKADRQHEHHDRMHTMKTAQQEKDLWMVQTNGGNVTAEANLGRDPHEHARKRDRERS